MKRDHKKITKEDAHDTTERHQKKTGHCIGRESRCVNGDERAADLSARLAMIYSEERKKRKTVVLLDHITDADTAKTHRRRHSHKETASVPAKIHHRRKDQERSAGSTARPFPKDEGPHVQRKRSVKQSSKRDSKHVRVDLPSERVGCRSSNVRRKVCDDASVSTTTTTNDAEHSSTKKTTEFGCITNQSKKKNAEPAQQLDSSATHKGVSSREDERQPTARTSEKSLSSHTTEPRDQWAAGSCDATVEAAIVTIRVPHIKQRYRIIKQDVVASATVNNATTLSQRLIDGVMTAASDVKNVLSGVVTERQEDIVGLLRSTGESVPLALEHVGVPLLCDSVVKKSGAKERLSTKLAAALEANERATKTLASGDALVVLNAARSIVISGETTTKRDGEVVVACHVCDERCIYKEATSHIGVRGCGVIAAAVTRDYGSVVADSISATDVWMCTTSGKIHVCTMELCDAKIPENDGTLACAFTRKVYGAIAIPNAKTYTQSGFHPSSLVVRANDNAVAMSHGAMSPTSVSWRSQEDGACGDRQPRRRRTTPTPRPCRRRTAASPWIPGNGNGRATAVADACLNRRASLVPGIDKMSNPRTVVLCEIAANEFESVAQRLFARWTPAITLYRPDPLSYVDVITTTAAVLVAVPEIMGHYPAVSTDVAAVHVDNYAKLALKCWVLVSTYAAAMTPPEQEVRKPPQKTVPSTPTAHSSYSPVPIPKRSSSVSLPPVSSTTQTNLLTENVGNTNPDVVHSQNLTVSIPSPRAVALSMPITQWYDTVDVSATKDPSDDKPTDQIPQRVVSADVVRANMAASDCRKPLDVSTKLRQVVIGTLYQHRYGFCVRPNLASVGKIYTDNESLVLKKLSEAMGTDVTPSTFEDEGAMQLLGQDSFITMKVVDETSLLGGGKTVDGVTVSGTALNDGVSIVTSCLAGIAVWSLSILVEDIVAGVDPSDALREYEERMTLASIS